MSQSRTVSFTYIYFVRGPAQSRIVYKLCIPVLRISPPRHSGPSVAMHNPRPAPILSTSRPRPRPDSASGSAPPTDRARAEGWPLRASTSLAHASRRAQHATLRAPPKHSARPSSMPATNRPRTCSDATPGPLRRPVERALRASGGLCRGLVRQPTDTAPAARLLPRLLPRPAAAAKPRIARDTAVPRLQAQLTRRSRYGAPSERCMMTRVIGA